jgi:hypothetical protein
MKKTLLTLLVSGALAATTHAQTIKQWDFNTPDGFPATGTVRPLVGSGYPAEATAGLLTQFGTVASGATTDPDTGNNSQWRLGSVGGTGGFPSATNDNKTAGAQFRVNTSGYENILVAWDQENSATASRYWRVQYTLNGTDWLDHPTVVPAVDSGDQVSTPPWQIGLSADFSAITGANNNPNFGFRLVSEFEATATGSGTNAYVANRLTNNYNINGTFWLDMVTVTGTDLAPANTWPLVSAITDQTTLMGEATAPLAFTVSDTETTAANLILSASSSNPALVSSLVLGGSAENRTIVATPVAGQVGKAIITVRAVDEGGKMTESSFELAVILPTVSPIADQATSWQVPLTNYFTVANLPGDSNTWVFTGTSSDTNIVTNEGLEFGNTGTNFSLTIAPVANAIGNTLITLTVTSGSWSATTNFNVLLLPEVIVYYDLNAIPNAAVASAPATQVAAGLTASDITRGPGIRAAALTRGFSADRWNSPVSTNNPSSPSRANAISRGDYFEITVTVEAGATVSLATFEAALRRSAVNAPMNYELQYSLDGFATPGVTIIPQGLIWDNLGWTQTTFTYLGRTSNGTVPANVTPYYYMLNDLPLRPNTTTSPGDPIPYIDLSGIAELQNMSGPRVITFRLYAWGNNNTVDTNTVAFGRVIGPSFRGYVSVSPVAPSLAIELVSGNIRVLWPTSAAGYSLQSTTSLSPASWGPAGGTLTVEGDNNVVTLSATGTQFFRLQQ